MEKVSKIKHSKLWNSVYNIVKQIPREDVDYDAVDAPSATTDIEKLFVKETNLLKEARDLLVLCSLIDKSGQCTELVDKIDKETGWR